MFVLIHIDMSDIYYQLTNIASSDSREKLEAFIPKYKEMRIEYTVKLDDVNVEFTKRSIAQNKNQSKLKPFKLDYSRLFYPFIVDDLDRFLYKSTAEQNNVFQEIRANILEEMGYPLTYIVRNENDEDFVIEEVKELV